MYLKPGVRIIGVKPEALLGMMIASNVFRDWNERLGITSVVEGKHSRGSIHYQGLAFDCRTKGLPEDAPAKIVQQLRERLGPDFDVILEPDHIHVEFQPKEPL